MSEGQQYAVIKAGGKQYRVGAGDRILVNRISSEVGSRVEIKDVLSLGGSEVKLGTPLLDGVSVSAVVVGHRLGKKELIFKKRRRKGYTKKIGHRQELTELRIEEIRN